jgi:hypothetical protein
MLALCCALGAALTACEEQSVSPGITYTDVFRQKTADAIDVLFVIDSSDTMVEEQDRVVLTFRYFWEFLDAAQVNYHIGVISTDVREEGKLYRAAGDSFIAPSSFSPVGIFLLNGKPGVEGARTERAFENTAWALGVGRSWEPGEPAFPPNAGFLRSNAALYIIMVSDDDDKSFGPPGYYARLFENYKGAGFEGRITVSAIVGPPEGCQSELGVALPGTRYTELAHSTGGMALSLCDEFETSMAMLGADAAYLDDTFELTRPANPDAVIKGCANQQAAFCVRVGEQVVPALRWTYDAALNAIVFVDGEEPTPGAAISIEYEAMP